MAGKSKAEREALEWQNAAIMAVFERTGFDYIAPEQSRDASKVGPRADIYSLGCSMYFALAGRPPFPTGTPKEKIQAHRRQEPEPIQNLNPTVPEGFAALVRQFMSKLPEQRPANMAARARIVEKPSGN